MIPTTPVAVPVAVPVSESGSIVQKKVQQSSTPALTQVVVPSTSQQQLRKCLKPTITTSKGGLFHGPRKYIPIGDYRRCTNNSPSLINPDCSNGIKCYLTHQDLQKIQLPVVIGTQVKDVNQQQLSKQSQQQTKKRIQTRRKSECVKQILQRYPNGSNLTISPEDISKYKICSGVDLNKTGP